MKRVDNKKNIIYQKTLNFARSVLFQIRGLELPLMKKVFVVHASLLKKNKLR